MIRAAERVHFVGVGGSGMSALAGLLAREGKQVSGSDSSAAAAELLARDGIALSIGHRPEHLGAAELVIRSAAVPTDNPELAEARRRGLPILSHAEALGALMRGRIGVAVAGTHGKSTTTAMLGFILAQAGLDPTVLVGATALNFGRGARSGRGRHFVVEADEYDRRFLALEPSLALITGIEADHLDYFRDLDEIVAAFRAFAERIAPDGVVVTCADDAVLAATGLPRRRLTYGFSAGSDWQLEAFRACRGGGCAFELAGPDFRGPVRLRLSGRHNAANAGGAIAAAVALGVEPGRALGALADFLGTERRFQTVFRDGGIWVIDDYAHHPTAVLATLAAAREVHAGRVWAVFQPHTSNRVSALFDDFVASFGSADRLTLLPIYRPTGREQGERTVSSADLAAAIRKPPVSLADSLEAAEDELAGGLGAGDLAVIMGAGDVTRLARGLACRLAARGRAG